MIETPAQPSRTPGQTRRRKALHNAAAGRTAVVLYVCAKDPAATAAQVVEKLSRYSDARDWEVVEIVLDTSSLSTPLADREQWQAACDVIDTRRAEGIVALQSHAGDASARAELTQWFAEHGAFLAAVEFSLRDRSGERMTA